MAPGAGLPFRRGVASSRVSAAACAASWSSQLSSPPRSARPHRRSPPNPPRPAPAAPPSSVDALATGAALQSLRDGGNAVDAAVAAAGVLGVVEPFSSGIGGGGFMVIRTKDGKVTTVDSRETAPAAMSPTSFFANGEPLEFDDARPQRAVGRRAGHGARLGPRAARLRDVVARARAEARHPRREGRLHRRRHASPGRSRRTRRAFAQVPSTAAIYLDPDGTPRDVGSTLRNPDLAGTYETIAKQGADAFYTGPIAQSIVDAVGPAARRTGRATRGVPARRHDDRRPRRVRGARARPDALAVPAAWDVYGMGPPSSGGTTVGEILNILDRTDLGGGDRAKALHLFMEASALAYADRGAYLADPAYVDVPVAGPALARVRLGAPRADRSGGDGAAPGPGRRPAPLRRRAAAGHGADDPAHGQHDAPHRRRRRRQRRLLHVHHRADRRQRDRRARPRVPAQQRADGLLLDDPDTPNRVEGGKRPRSSMAPTIVERDGEPLLALGLAGRRDDHHHGRPGALRPPRARLAAAGRGGGAARVRAQHRRRPTPSPASSPRPRARRWRRRTATSSTRSTRSAPSPASSGWATAGCCAAAEPVRRGGGSAGVVTPGG